MKETSHKRYIIDDLNLYEIFRKGKTLEIDGFQGLGVEPGIDCRLHMETFRSDKVLQNWIVKMVVELLKILIWSIYTLSPLCINYNSRRV